MNERRTDIAIHVLAVILYLVLVLPHLALFTISSP